MLSTTFLREISVIQVKRKVILKLSKLIICVSLTLSYTKKIALVLKKRFQ